MRSNRWPLIAVILTIGLCPGHPWAVEPSHQDLATEVDAYLSRIEKLGFAGVLLIAVGDEILLEGGYGLANREAETPWSSRTISTVGSITKQFTATAILQLEERGLLSTDDLISKYFDSVPEDKAGITLHHLLTHSSGIVDLEGYGDFDALSREGFVALAMKAPLAFEPGTGYEYSNAGYSLLGMIIEQLTEKSYEEYIQQNLFLAAGMRETGYLLPDWDEERLAIGYRGAERWGTVLERPMAEDGPYWVLRANGGIHSTAMDMRHWAQALLSHRVLDPESRGKLWTGYVDEGGGDSFYGYGWVLRDGPGGEPLVMHNGGNTIFFADLVILPEHEAAIFLMTNVSSGYWGARRLAMQVVDRWLAGEPLPEVPEVVEMAPELLEPLVGAYELENKALVTVSLDGGALTIVTDDQDVYALLHSSVEVDLETARERNEVIEGLLTGFLEGDYQPTFEAYDGRVPVERLQGRGEETRRQLEEEYGPLKGFGVLGTGFSEGRSFTAARIDFERQPFYRLYVWETDGTLLGYAPREVLPPPRFFPVGEGEFQSWDSRFNVSSIVAFAEGKGGKTNLALGEPSRLTATRN